MSTQIAEAPPASSSASAAKPLPTASEAGLTSMADAFKKAAGTPVAEPKATQAPESPVTQEKPVAAKPALLESLSEPELKQAKEEPKAMEAKRAADWKALKEEREQFRTEAETLRKEMEKAKGWEKELNDLRPKAEKADEYAKRLYETAFEKSDDFQRIVSAQDEIVSAAKTLAKEFEVGDDVIDKAMMLKGRKRLDFLEETFGNPTAAGKFDRMLDEYDAKEGQKTSEVRRSRETMEKMSATERELALNEAARAKQAIIETFDSSIPKFEAKLPGFFKRKDGDEAHNAIVDQVIKTAKEIAGTDDPEIQTEAMALAAVAHTILPKYAELQKKYAKLEERLKAYSANEPRITGSSENESNGAGERVGMMERWKQGVR